MQPKIPRKLIEKRDAVLEHRNKLENNRDLLKNENVEPIVRSSYKVAAQIMTSIEDNICNVKIHIKQHLNELKRIDELIKVTTNDKTSNTIRLSQCNNMDLLNTIKYFCKEIGSLEGCGKGIRMVKNTYRM